MPDAALLQEVERPMGRLFAYLRPFRARLYKATSWAFLNKIFDLFPPLLVAWLIDCVTGKTPDWIVYFVGTNEGLTPILFVAALTVFVFGLESLFQWLYAVAFMTLAQDTQHRLRVDAYRAMQAREIRFFEEHRLGKTLAMLNDDVNQLERFLNSGFVDFVHLATLILFAGSVLCGISWELALAGLAPVPIIVWGSLKFARKLEPRYVKVREAVGDLAARLENNIGGVLVVKSFTAEEYETQRVEEVSDAYRRANHHAISLSAVFVPMIRGAIAVGFATVIVLGGWWALQGKVTAGTLVLFGMMIQRMLWPMTRLGQTLDEYQRARASAARIFSLLDTPCAVQDPADPVPLDDVRGTVEFRDVHFRYRTTEPILDGLSFRVAPGETVGIAGPTGSGKSTLIKLLLRLYDVNEGAVLLDDHDVRSVSQHDLRRHVALVSQDVYVFHGTIAENIAYGGLEGPAGDDIARGIEQAARQAQLHEFIASLPEGYETIVGERGIKLSGGQRQRLSLARAILKDAPVLVLDEATSSVDTETERAIQQNLERFTRGRTALVIAHRLSTIRHADRILVIRDGKVTEQGHHDDLVALGGTYADLWAVQSGELTSATASTPSRT